jgi:thiamine biosynthesis lipoprotein
LLSPRGEAWTASFQAMAGPCEVLMEVRDRKLAHRIGRRAADEAWRVESKFSRYRGGNVVHAINTSDGKPVGLDDETARLIGFADQLFRLSERRFDITSGALRRAWHFDGSDAVPDAGAVERILCNVGWERVRRTESSIALQPGMEIDLGGICKEYAVDRAAALAAAETDSSCLVNFGGDIAITSSPADGGWRVGVESARAPGAGAEKIIRLSSGGLATSGDTRRYLLRDGVRYGHILDPTTGWPVQDAARSITVAAGSCTEAGMLATLAMLKGPDAESFLEDEGVQHWMIR